MIKIAHATNYWQEYFRNVSPSWMENWYEDLAELTIPSNYFRIYKQEVDNLLSWFDRESAPPESFIKKLDTTIKLTIKCNDCNKVFVRLGSRSPKDHFKFDEGVKEPKDVLMLFSDSARIMEDLLLCQNVGYEPYLFVRVWKDIKRSQEFRCFVKAGKLKGITQYYYREKYHYLDSEEARNNIRQQADSLLSQIISRIKLRDFIFDIEYLPGKDLPLLIEINPYSSWTDPALFDWAIDKFNEFEFRWLQSLERVKHK